VRFPIAGCCRSKHAYTLPPHSLTHTVLSPIAGCCRSKHAYTLPPHRLTHTVLSPIAGCCRSVSLDCAAKAADPESLMHCYETYAQLITTAKTAQVRVRRCLCVCMHRCVCAQTIVACTVTRRTHSSLLRLKRHRCVCAGVCVCACTGVCVCANNSCMHCYKTYAQLITTAKTAQVRVRRCLCCVCMHRCVCAQTIVVCTATRRTHSSLLRLKQHRCVCAGVCVCACTGVCVRKQ